MKSYLRTAIYLPPGVPPNLLVRELLQCALEEHRWFKPMRYGFASLKKRIDPEHIDYDALMAFYGEWKTLTVAARADQDYVLIDPAKPSVPPYTGDIIWSTSLVKVERPDWRVAHLQQVAEVMQRVGSPLAQAGIDESFWQKTQRIVPEPDGVGEKEISTVRDYSEGLAGAFWRNFFGPPFVRLFGERLHSLPAGCTREELGGGIVLVQPYEAPALAGTEEGLARERALIAHLGPECFYDHERHLKPTRLPELPPAPTSAVKPGA